mmetsp:Transcript_10004/g.32433  ORF Transcript_10004/g.32433 Transcript_10004/m.32433 type:complete len:329 (+) Transcript_10004:34-1020(+)|eukprot:CAMPEP_0182912382 /NCGR_PEP_ID=MMETSP0034_2-20130328/37486_1 /TAXON_ID=156128 /ORGANISM="Nephroselmis pyriformis, Strain CCMP717" /LENGTH=328 /DNA_ID=CAMNT_0025049051 /DNA_START=33 /DNA_END=1019 /DNA_ORIENTATION=-
MNFAAAASAPKEETALRSVHLDGQVVLKIVKHCKENLPNLVTGQLLGLDIGSTLEITNCFPYPSARADEDAEEDADGFYQLEMMRCLRDVNVDNNHVGWYQSTYMGSFQTVELIETFLNYQESIKHCVCIIYDPVRSQQGVLSLKALKLRDNFMEVYKGSTFTEAALKKAGLSWTDVFQEIPVTITNSPLSTAMMAEIQSESMSTQADFDRMSLSTNPFMEKNLEFLIECMDDLAVEQQKMVFYQRNLQRYGQQQAQWQQKRRVENATRKANGDEPLPEEDPSLKAPTEPSKLDSFLITNQISNYCGQIKDFSSQSLQKLYLMEGLHQ